MHCAFPSQTMTLRFQITICQDYSLFLPVGLGGNRFKHIHLKIGQSWHICSEIPGFQECHMLKVCSAMERAWSRLGFLSRKQNKTNTLKAYLPFASSQAWVIHQVPGFEGKEKNSLGSYK